uniref:Uncharacterized protein n=1 Tax=Chromera velia CCMP2878 TaxID=1169474 RepID=A0A0G4IES1_9ALVE|mmetsp:Transcript_21565/g.42852  ORF Transcript_21565/g.42852 Transcript_21565/m.42852 type:complete len:122 (-) Transcript_21565:438-803(-)|eukprot:Cvel_13726.t1-p1 / transcript=Cvel_13726.t1 / gene=Cvel_13726 / organism=Chromera_velia_CCMP2878 / gene_product=hypothetical protein / transcript_product=hypothetical protein / location=Cvel_scaffold949:31151-33621(+) / protein_length=121 / sequence_SO=supercontig / SO=protein_coding / is_pseudo=false
MLRAARRSASVALSGGVQVPAAIQTWHRLRSTIRFVDDKGLGEESIYFKREDEGLLKNLLANHPEYDPRFVMTATDKELGKLQKDIFLVCKKHGIQGATVAFMKDLTSAFEANGYKPGGSP